MAGRSLDDPAGVSPRLVTWQARAASAGREVGLGADDVEHLAAGTGGVEREGVRGRVTELEFVGAARRAHVELAVVEQVHLVDAGAEASS